ncbi:MAG: cytidylate kinase-like family protein [Syntrophobacterales bacterium]|jgi:cytidylate kinase
MSIITISRGSYTRGKEVAEKLAQALGYQCLSRDIILEASERYNIPEIKLVRAIHDAPSILERFTYSKGPFVAYIRAALLRQVQKDNVVYHGLAGHFFLKKIPHVLKVRIIADLEDRVKEEMKRENISAEEARQILLKDDEERRKWSNSLYGIDTRDASLYDLVINIKCITVNSAVDTIQCSLKDPCFQTTPEGQKLVEEMSLAAGIEAALIQDIPSIQVEAKDAEVFIYLKRDLCKDKELISRIKRLASNVAGSDIKINCLTRS